MLNKIIWTLAIIAILIIGIVLGAVLFPKSTTPETNKPVALKNDTDKLPVQNSDATLNQLNTPTNQINEQANTMPENNTTDQAAPLEPSKQPILTDKYSMATIYTNAGNIKVKFYKDESPVTVNNFLYLASTGFYNQTKFHRIIKDFMIQGGDPLSKTTNKAVYGTGNPGYAFADEFNKHSLIKGSLAMANAGPNSNGSQFFIVTAESTPWLDGKHTNFGEVIEGLDIVAKLGNVATDGNDLPLEDIIIDKIVLE